MSCLADISPTGCPSDRKTSAVQLLGHSSHVRAFCFSESLHDPARQQVHEILLLARDNIDKYDAIDFAIDDAVV